MPFVPMGVCGWLIGVLLEELFSHPHAGSKAKAGAVRFAPSQPSEGNPGHVHFDEKLRDSAVMVTQERDGHVLVKVLAGLRGPGRAGQRGGCPQGRTAGLRPLPQETKGSVVPRCPMKQSDVKSPFGALGLLASNCCGSLSHGCPRCCGCPQCCGCPTQVLLAQLGALTLPTGWVSSHHPG